MVENKRELKKTREKNDDKKRRTFFEREANYKFCIPSKQSPINSKEASKNTKFVVCFPFKKLFVFVILLFF